MLHSLQRRFFSASVALFITITSQSAFAGVQGGGGTLSRVWRGGVGKFLDDLVAFLIGDFARLVALLVMIGLFYRMYRADDRQRAFVDMVIAGVLLGALVNVDVIVDAIFSSSGALLMVV